MSHFLSFVSSKDHAKPVEPEQTAQSEFRTQITRFESYLPIAPSVSIRQDRGEEGIESVASVIADRRKVQKALKIGPWKEGSLFHPGIEAVDRVAG